MGVSMLLIDINLSMLSGDFPSYVLTLWYILEMMAVAVAPQTTQTY